MAYLNEEELYTAYSEASDEADQWRIDYPEYERLADNGLMEALDENLPEVNDGSLAASLFKLAKRVIKKKPAGRAVALDRDDDWITELANIYWERKILPNAKSKASPRRKWKDAVRKAAIYGGQPIVTLFVQRGNYRGSDFIVPYAQDVKLEAGKDSDADSDVIFWDVYYSKLQVENMLEEALQETGQKIQTKKDDQGNDSYEVVNDPEAKPNPEPYNKWNIPLLKELIEENEQEERPGNQQPNAEQGQGKVKRTGIHFCLALQRGVNAPFSLYHPSKKKSVRQWSNPDPTGDLPVHYLYMYQDFVNPYGVGIVKLAGGTQNVLDYMRQADVLATQVGIRPPKVISGDEDQVDEDSMVMAQDANWYVGQANVTPWNMATGVYQQLPGRISMYQTSLQKIIPMGDTTISAGDSGDPQVSKVPASIKLQAASLSIDDEDLAENVDECYAEVAKSMINTQFANMQGTDLLRLNADERERLTKAGIPFEIDPISGKPGGDLNVVWDNARATFDYKMDADADKTTDEEKQLDGLVKVADFVKDPTTQALITSGQPIILGTKKLDVGELIGEIINLTTDNDKILVDVSPEDQDAMAEQEALKAQAAIEGGGMPPQPGAPQVPGAAPANPQQPPAGPVPPQAAAAPMAPPVAPAMPMQPQPAQPITPPAAPEQPAPPAASTQMAAGYFTPEEQQAGEHIKMVMQAYGVDENIAVAMLEAESQGFEPEEILAHMQANGLMPTAQPEPANV